jgi:hypothetical protein
MPQKVTTYILAAISIGMILLGLAWNSVFPPDSYWSQEKALEYRDAFRAAHAAQDASSHDKQAAIEAQLKASWKHYEELQAELSEAQKARSRGGKAIVVVGLILLLAAIISRRYWPASADSDHD